jgi:cytochrome P450
MPQLDPVAAVTAPDPYPYYRDLVATRPFHRDDALGLWVAASAGSVNAMLAESAARVRPAAEPVPKPLAGGPAGAVFGKFARMTDGPAQAAMKIAIRAALADVTAGRVTGLARDWLTQRLRGGAILSDMALNDILFELPVSVVASLLGVAPARHGALCAAVADLVAGVAAGASRARIDAAHAAVARLLDRLAPSFSWSSGLVASLRLAAADAPPAAVLANALGLLFQTHEATAGLVGNTLLAAVRHRAAYDRAVAQRRLADFVAEVQRSDPPVHNTRRFLAADAVIEGQALRAGDAVLVVLAAANHDAAANPAPERFDIDRADRRSFTFGKGGHACPGEIIATAVAAAAAETLVPKLAGLDHLAESVGYRPLPNARIPVFGGRNAQGGVP